MRRSKALTIAGSDSGGGAGIQADLKTFQERDVFGTSVITAVTAQNTTGVHGVYPQSEEAIEAQLKAVMNDIGADAAKTGMLFSAPIIERVAWIWQSCSKPPLVVDPVMIAKGGAPLLQKEAVDALTRTLLPLATLVTPNMPEAFALVGMDEDDTPEAIEEAAKAIYALGPTYVLIKGGHRTRDDESSIDVLYDGVSFKQFIAPRIDTKHTHGTGCTYSAAITAELAKGQSLLHAITIGKAFITEAIKGGRSIGKGIGPTDHAAYRHQYFKDYDYVKII